MIERLIKFQERKGQFANGGELSASLKNDNFLRQEIEYLSTQLLGRSVSGCSNCYMDAYLQLITFNIKKAMEKLECKFQLRSGALLQDVVRGDINLNTSKHNLSNELALYHLKTNPKCEELFEKLPEDLAQLLEDYQLPNTVNPASDKEIKQPKAGNVSASKGDDLQTQAESDLVNTIAQDLKTGLTKTAIREKYATNEKLGEKTLNARFIGELIKRAETIVKPQE